MKFLSRPRKAMAGFTLVELMVVVAIIGILSAVAIPQFAKYQAKSKTSEAKLQLASMYTAMTSFYADFDTYAQCLSYMGVTVPQANYYASGFDAAGADDEATAVANGAGGACVDGFAQDSEYFVANKIVNGTTADETYLQGGSLGTLTVSNNGTTFNVGAAGVIDGAFTSVLNADQWLMNENKVLTLINNGY